MPPRVTARCWDSDAILGWLQQEDGKWQDCQGVMQAAKEGRTVIVVSALAIAEVLMLRGHDKIPVERADTVRAFFQNSWIKTRPLNRFTAELAQNLVWDHGIDPKDAIHVATAIKAQVPRLDTFDGDLIGKSGTIAGSSLIIGRPDMSYAATMEESVAKD